jgi:ABC-2 type transport system permease protein
MKLSLRVVRASFLKEMWVWKRNPQKIALVLLLPLLFFTAFTLLMGGVYYGTGVETALIVEEQNPGVYTNGLIETLGQYDPIPPRLNPIIMDADIANALFDNGEILLVITIPDGFEESIANNMTTSIHVRVANIHEDLTKNLRMPVIRKLDIFCQTYLPEDTLVSFEIETLHSFTPPRLAYMAWTMSVYAVMVGAMFAAGSAMTQEFENKTVDELNLSNQSSHSIFLGKMFSAVVISFIAPPFLFLLSYLLFGVWPQGDIVTYLSLSFLLSIFCSGIGIMLGAWVRNSVFMVPLAALAGLYYWIVGGGIAPLEILGLSFGPINEYAPVSNVYRSLIRMFVEGSYTSLAIDLSVMGLFAAVFIVVTPLVAERVTRIDFAQRLENARRRRK